MEAPVRLTALIITLNGERLLGKCLESLSFCDRVLIVDSFSSDKTEDIARSHGAIFIQNKWPGNAKQIRYGIDWLAANAPTAWALMPVLRRIPDTRRLLSRQAVPPVPAGRHPH